MNTINKIISCVILLGLAALLPGISQARPAEIPRMWGQNIYGWVGSNNKGLPGVVVSDGFLTTTTDANGIYYLSSQKKHGYVFISIPANYEAPVVKGIPQFFHRLKADENTPERADFVLTPADNECHVVLAYADAHLHTDVPFSVPLFRKFAADINSVADSYRAAGTRPYVLNLGDHVPLDGFLATIEDLAAALQLFNSPVFSVIGNHDFLRFGADLHVRSRPWKNTVGPTYYSFNLGKIHYVVLCPFEPDGTLRGIKVGIPDDQLKWLKKDLSHVSDKSAPLVIALHLPVYGAVGADNQARESFPNTQQLLGCLDGFSNVLSLGGHSHRNSKYVASPRLMDHHIAGGGMWEEITFAGSYVALDGSPGGYGVYEADGKNLRWHYKGVGLDRNYQFRTYDRNRIHITAEKHAPGAYPGHAALVPKHAAPYHVPSNDNEVLINVWGYDPAWKIEVLEGAVSLPVTRIMTKDPLAVITNFKTIFTTRVLASPGRRNNPLPGTSHIFKVKAGSPDSTLHIKVTDRFGNIYTETMKRPKELALDMK